MKKKLTVALVASLVLSLAVCVGIYMMSDSGPSTDEWTASTDDATAESTSRPIGLDASMARKAASDASQTTVAVEDTQLDGLTLSGTVRDESMEPVPGARVLVVRESDSRGSVFDAMRRGDRSSFRELVLRRQRGEIEPRVARSQSMIVAETVTDLEGAYSFLLESLPRGEFHVLAQKTGMAPRTEEWAWVPQSTVIDFRLGTGEVITGIVIDGREGPVARASVAAIPDRGDRGRFEFFRGGRGGGGDGVAAQTFTDDEGRFTLHVATGTYRVAAAADRFKPESVSDVESGTRDVVVALEPSALIAGKVEDADGRAIADAVVELHGSDLSGRGFRGRGDRGRGGRGSGDRERRGGDGEDDDRDDDSRPGFRRWLSNPEAVARTDASGEFRFEDVGSSSFTLIARRPGYVASQRTGELRKDAPVEPITLSLATAAVIAGVVTDHSGEPVPGAFVAVGSAGSRDPRFGGRGGRGDRGFGRGGGDRGDRGDRGARGRRGDGDRGERGEQDGDPSSGGENAEEEPPPPEPVSIFRLSTGAETDESGRFVIDTLPDGEYALSVETDRHPVSRVDPLVVEERVDVDIQLEEGLTLRGTVVSGRDRAPLPGAELRFSFSRSERRYVTSGEDGSYEIAGFVTPVIEEVRASAPGHTASYYRDVEVGSGELDFEVEVGARVAGQVVDASGNPIPRARVSLAPVIALEDDDDDVRSAFRETMRRSDRETTNGEGRFVFEELAGGLSYNVSVEHSDYERLAAGEITVGSGDNIDDLKLVMRTGARVEVLVVAPDGFPVQRASVRIEHQDDGQRAAAPEGEPEPVDRDEARRRGMQRALERFARGDRGENRRRQRSTGPDGRATFPGMLPGRYLVRVEARGFQNAYIETWAADESTANATVNLQPEHAITGTVIDLAGAPVSRASIVATRETPDPIAARAQESEGRDGGRGGRFGFERGSRGERSETRSDNDGSFRLGQLAASTYRIDVRARGFADVRLEGVPVDRPINVRLEPLGAISGQVVSARTGLPVTAFRVRLREAEVTAAVASTEDGGAPEGAPTSGDDGAASRRPGGGPGGRFGGRGGFGGFGGGFGRGSDRWRPFEDPNGAFVIDDREPGSYTIDVVADGFTGTTVSARVLPGATTEVAVALEEGLSVRGTVVRERTVEPLPGAIVYLVPVAPEREDDAGEAERGRRERAGPRRFDPTRRRERRSSAQQEASVAVALLATARKSGEGQRTDENGSFRLPEVPEGRYVLVVDHESQLPLGREIDVRDGMLSDYVLRLGDGESLSGAVTVDGSAGVGLMVTVQGADGFTRRATTGAGGRYEVTGLIPGTYAVSVRQGPGAVANPVTVEIAAGRNEFDYDHTSAEQEPR